MKIKFLIAIFFTLYFTNSIAQPSNDLFVKDAIKANRIKQYSNIVKNAITKNLSLPLNDSTEEYWQDAFWAMELIQYKAPWVKTIISKTFDSLQNRSTSFQRALLELAYTNYQKEYLPAVNQFITTTNNAKIFAMCSEYLLNNNASTKTINTIKSQLSQKFAADTGNAILKMLCQRLSYFSGCTSKNDNDKDLLKNILKDILNKNAFTNSVVVYSFQRQNRNYPGLAIVRDKDGNFVKDDKGIIISIPQLARSIPNLPGYLTNGNTPQGNFRMDGFDISKSNFIGPTTNIQLTMPYENSIAHFLKDSTITDSIWNENYYKKI